MQGIKVKSVSETLLSVKQINPVWEARCVLLID